MTKASPTKDFLSRMLQEESERELDDFSQTANSLRSDTTEVVHICVASIAPNPMQIRNCTQEQSSAIKELADSIKQQGVIEPLIVEKVDGDRYAVLCGHRRWEASRQAGKTTVPCVVLNKKLSDEQRIEIILTENLQRKELSALELSEGYDRLRQLGYTQVQIAEKIGKSKHHVNKALAFRQRLSKEELDRLREIESSRTLEFVRLEIGSKVSDPELRRRALFEDVPLSKVKQHVKSQGSNKRSSEKLEKRYHVEHKTESTHAVLKISGHAMSKTVVGELVRILTDKVVERYGI